MKPVCRLLARACSHLQICHNNNDKVINKNIGAYSYGPQRRPYPGQRSGVSCRRTTGFHHGSARGDHLRQPRLLPHRRLPRRGAGRPQSQPGTPPRHAQGRLRRSLGPPQGGQTLARHGEEPLQGWPLLLGRCLCDPHLRGQPDQRLPVGALQAGSPAQAHRQPDLPGPAQGGARHQQPPPPSPVPACRCSRCCCSACWAGPPAVRARRPPC